MWNEGREPELTARAERARRPVDLVLMSAVLACVALDAALSFALGPFAQVWEFLLLPLTLVLMLAAAITVLVASSRRSLWARATLALIIIGVPYVYARSGALYELQDIGLRRYVRSRVDLADLQTAAVGLIDAQRGSGKTPGYGPRFEESDHMPASVRGLEPYRVLVVPASGDRHAYVFIGWGAGHLSHFGVLLGAPEYHPDNPEDTRQWVPGIYGLYSRHGLGRAL